ncbi:MAG TPA: FAD-dependent oxidoreductase [Gaiellaceae bacterium]|nr:FAD-dependent oxidoreductase [Gaiellaceae bacterium]
MPDFRYLIVGGGMTADAACRGIRDHDPDGAIGLVGAEPEPPYARPPLSKGLWQGKDEETIWRGTAELGVDLRLGRRVVELDLAGRRAVDDRGDAYGYERLLLATGGRPRRLPGDGGDGVVYFRTLADYRRLRALASAGARVVVVGGGFIGSELAAALTRSGCAVTMVFPESGIGGRLFPAELAGFVTDYYREQGVEVLPGELVAAIEGGTVRLGGGRVLEADGVVAGLGIEPAVELAEAAGLPVEDGIVVDDRGRAGGRDDVFAAGDVARFPAKDLGTLVRVEHEDHANGHGRAVGANMAGADAPYDRLPFFYSDLFELGYEAVGELDSRLETAAEWAEPNRKGVVCYLDGERRPRGFLLWDVWGKVDDARALIAAARPLERGDLRALLD